MARFCSECGRPLTGGKFCGECGVPILGGGAPSDIPAAINDWPCSGGGPGRANFAFSERSITRDNISNYAPAWAFVCDRGIDTQPVVVNDRVFVGTMSAYDASGDQPEAALTCIDARLGRLVWRNDTTGLYNSNLGNLVGAPTYAAPWLLCQFDNGPLWAVDADSGREETAVYLGSCGQRDCEPLPAVSRGFLFHAEYGSVRVGSIQDLLYGDGRIQWDWWMQQTVLDTGSDVMGAIAVDSGLAWALTDRGAWVGPGNRLFASAQCIDFPEEVTETFRDPESDDDPDHWQWNNIDCSGAASALGSALTRITVTNSETSEFVSSAVVSFLAKKSSAAWHVLSSTVQFSAPALAYDMAFFGDSLGCLRAISLRSGHEVWSTQVSGEGLQLCVPLIVNQLAIVGDDGGSLFALDVLTGDLIHTWAIGSAITCSPSVAGGKIYVATRSGVTALTLAA